MSTSESSEWMTEDEEGGPAQTTRRRRPLQHELAQELNQRTTGLNKRRLCSAPLLDAGLDLFSDTVTVRGPALASQPHDVASPQLSRKPTSVQRLPSIHGSTCFSELLASTSSTSTHITEAAPDSTALPGATASEPTGALLGVKALEPAGPIDTEEAADTVAGTSGVEHAPTTAPLTIGLQSGAADVRQSAGTGSAAGSSTQNQGGQQRAPKPRRARKQPRVEPPPPEEEEEQPIMVLDQSTRRSPRIMMILRRMVHMAEPSSSTAAAAAASNRTRARRRHVLASDDEEDNHNDESEQEDSEGDDTEEESERSDEEEAPCSGVVNTNHTRLLLKRELGFGDAARFLPHQQLHLQCQDRALPFQPARQVSDEDNRAYIGQFSKDGAYFVCAYQDQKVRVFDVHNRFNVRKEVRPRGVRWTITDTCTSPDQQFLLYASIHPCVHMVNIGASATPVNSLANITEVHERLEFRPGEAEGSFGIWSVRWSRHGNQLIAGTNDDSVYVYDMNEGKVVARARGHEDDVNAVEYLDESPNLILTGSDDHMIKLWDRRTMPAGFGLSGQRGHAQPAGVMVGHTEGLTHLNTRGDGRYFISNCKDQCVKLWDIRMGLRTASEAAALSRRPVPRFHWDYRWMEYPGRNQDIKHPHDASIMTYRGHKVLQTLIRAYFSPAATTGQKFIYSGSADGKIHVWDVVTGLKVAALEHHSGLVRDVSWHPHEPMIASVSWDGCVIAWAPSALAGDRWGGEPCRQRRHHMRDRGGWW